jgi:FlaA1/EpsC-like NDP-sugar epimerase
MPIILVTGGAGFLGQALVDKLYKLDCTVRVMSRNESSLNNLKVKYPKVELFCGDVSDEYSVKNACRGVDSLFHLAAFKHVSLAEKFPMECIKSNVIGSLNLLKESVNQKMRRAFFVSTDKAFTLKGNYSISKFLMEQMVREYSTLNPDTTYQIIRFGNLLYSSGSVLCYWKDELLKGRDIKLTDPEAVRFFLSKEQAVDFIYKQMDSEEFLTSPKIKSVKMGRLAQAMIKKYNPNQSYKIIGLQAGESLSEKINEENTYEEYTDEEIFSMI